MQRLVKYEGGAKARLELCEAGTYVNEKTTRRCRQESTSVVTEGVTASVGKHERLQQFFGSNASTVEFALRRATVTQLELFINGGAARSVKVVKRQLKTQADC